jgi:hypothetical protein
MHITMSLGTDIYVAKKIKLTILGIAVKYGDEEVDAKSFKFEDISRQDEFDKIEKFEDNNSEVIFKINADLTKVINVWYYFTISDIFARIGGYKALADPIFAMFFPLMTLSYLHKLSRIIKQNKIKEYLAELKRLSFDLFVKLKHDQELQKKIVEYNHKL